MSAARFTYRVVATFALFALSFAWGAILASQANAAASVASGSRARDPEPLQRLTLHRVTYYHAVPEQTDDDPFTSACGPNRPNQIAVSRDVFRTVLPCGTRVRLDLDGVGYAGEFIVWDTMARRFTSAADILVETGHHPTWGRTTGTLTILELP
jgi:3D (Asp-Asp-Asp) domain-containing protein